MNVGKTDSAWIINFSSGYVSHGYYNSGSYYVRAVRGGAAFGAFLDNGDGTVTDTSTGLMWQQETAGPMNWEAALTYCEDLSLAGYNDWRLPNRNELQSLVDYTTVRPAIDTTAFADTLSSDYWSSTTQAGSTGSAWRVHFLDGIVFGYDKSDSYMEYVRAVRGGNTSPTSTYPDTVVDTIPMSSSPLNVAVTPDGGYVYVTNDFANTVSVIQTSDNTVVDTISVGNEPYGVAVAPSGSYVYVANWWEDTVSVIQTSDNAVINTISVGDGPWGVAVTPNGSYVYVANWNDNTVSVIQTSDNTVVDTISVGNGCLGVAVTPSGSYFYVTNNHDNTVSVIGVAQ